MMAADQTLRNNPGMVEDTHRVNGSIRRIIRIIITLQLIISIS